MLFSRVAAFTIALPLLASATVLPRTSSSDCGTDNIKCCNSLQSVGSGLVTTLAGLLNLDLSSVTGLVGITCSPLSILGLGSNSCSAQPVCCTGNTFSGLLSLGCSPIDL